MKVGFIGLGNVGGKLADSLLRNKFDLTVIDLDSSLTKDLPYPVNTLPNFIPCGNSIDSFMDSFWPRTHDCIRE